MPTTEITTINSTALDLPDSANPTTWNAEQRALMEFAGLAWRVPAPELREGDGPVPTKVVYAPAGVAQAFIAAVKRSGLDPFARQIYVAEVGGKWTILGAIDGFRAIVEASKEYEGRTPIEYTADGVTWVQAWLDPKTPPAAARVGIYRRGFREAVYTTITWAEFGSTRAQWAKMPVWMLGIRLLSHAYRDSFPQKLSGIYTPEDFDNEADNEAEVKALLAEVEKITDKAVLTKFYEQHEAELPNAVRAAIMARAGMIQAESAVSVVPQGVEPESVPAEEEPGAGATSATQPRGSAHDGGSTPQNGAQRRDPRPDSVVREPDDPDYEAWLDRVAQAALAAEEDR